MIKLIWNAFKMLMSITTILSYIMYEILYINVPEWFQIIGFGWLLLLPIIVIAESATAFFEEK
ncbi:MAG: hypothetical protein RBR02_06320 [Desulfuromonadaceae bacterium]|nr:hypothetical protein [Desulfuromonadaceae bacterium]